MVLIKSYIKQEHYVFIATKELLLMMMKVGQISLFQGKIMWFQPLILALIQA